MSILGTGSCSLCEGVSPPVSSALALCAHCLRERFADVKSRVQAVHLASRAEFGLPGEPPRHPNGIRCTLCANECVIGEGQRGYCGLRTVRRSRLRHLAGTPARGLLHWYRDPLPTRPWTSPSTPEAASSSI